MFKIKNTTPFAVSLSPQVNLQGHDVLQVFFAASCRRSQGGRWLVCDDQMEAPLSDQRWDQDKDSSIRFPSQLSHDKPGTDVIVNAHAVAPGAKPVTALKASVEVGALKAAVGVFGDRMWHRGQISNPRPFVQMPITWETAFGGLSRADTTDEQALPHESNPLGMGWTHSAHPVLDGKRLPNVESLQQLIRDPRDNPAPVGFGAVPAESPWRSSFAGTYDSKWQATRAPFAPEDFDPAFFYAAIPPLRSPAPMRGNEAVRLRNLHPSGEVVFNLPSVRPVGQATIVDAKTALDFSLQTVLIETQALIVRMFWQAVVPAPRSVADIKELHVALAR